MLAAVEISMYPLAADYRPLIEAFIVRLNSYPELQVVTNSLSTQIWGPLDRLMVILGEEMGRVASAGPQPVFVMKVLPGLARPAKERPLEDRPAEARPPTASAVPAPP